MKKGVKIVGIFPTTIFVDNRNMEEYLDKILSERTIGLIYAFYIR